MRIKHFLPGMAACILPVAAHQTPNILIIQCDHLTQRVVGAYGETTGLTPAIDEVASQGIIFSNAYVGSPLSQPSRAALWTGMMPHQINVRSNSDEPINRRVPEDLPTLGSLFSTNGYHAVHFGKTHDMGALRGFIHKDPEAEPFEDPDFPVNRDSFLDEGTCKDVVNYLNNPPKEPFICIADFLNPHNICGFIGENAGVHVDQLFSGPLPELPDNFEVNNWDNIPQPVQYICCSHRRMTQASPWSETNYQHYIAAFHHYTRMVDNHIRKVIDALHSTPAGENTVIVILSDHGDGMASHRMVTKHISFYEEITNIPLIFAGPGIAHREKPVTDLLVQATTDLLPTLCELAGITLPKDKPGISIAPSLRREEQADKHPYVVSEWHSEYERVVTPGRMIRSQRYKYTHYLEGEGEELYNLENDRGEQYNLAGLPEYKSILEAHRAMLEDYILRTADDYRTLEVIADERCRAHPPGYPNHTGPGAWEMFRK